jgi:hypothetical protein
MYRVLTKKNIEKENIRIENRIIVHRGSLEKPKITDNVPHINKGLVAKSQLLNITEG